MERRYTWDLHTGKMEPGLLAAFAERRTTSHIPAKERCWEDELEQYLEALREWLYEPANIHGTLADVENMLIQKHHDYGEDNLKKFGELGILVRASDKIARLKNLIDKQGEVKDESREDTWLDLAGYAIQALVMIKLAKESEKVNVFEIRKNRLIRGHCPDCGEGVLLRDNYWDNRLQCSQRCGFTTGDLYPIHLNYPDFTAMIEFLASQEAFTEQK